MDRRSWLWRKRSSEKSPGETESSGSVSSQSERFFDDQPYPTHSFVSPEVTPRAVTTDEEFNDNLKTLTGKLSAALLNISVKEESVRQHAKVAEEAVAGWEKAENEVLVYKQQLEDAQKKNSELEDRVDQLDGALKECLRQLRQSKEEQDQKIKEAIYKRSREWECQKSELESQLAELQDQLQMVKTNSAMVYPHFQQELEALEKENAALKLDVLSNAEEMELRILERDLSVQAAEATSKQYLESIKRVAKLEAECRRLQAIAKKSRSAINHESEAVFTGYVESFTDSQSDYGERLMVVGNEIRELETYKCMPNRSNSQASVLTTELCQFMNGSGKPMEKSHMVTSKNIDLMDDFLEMERLVASPFTEAGNSHETRSENDQTSGGERELKRKVEALTHRTAELEEKLENIDAEKLQLEMAVSKSKKHITTLQTQLKEAVEKLLKLQKIEGEKLELEVSLDVLRKQFETTQSQLKKAERELQKFEKINAQKLELETTLIETQKRLETSELQLKSVEKKSEELQTQLDHASKSKQAAEKEVNTVQVLREVAEIRIRDVEAEVSTLLSKIESLKKEIERERSLSIKKINILQSNIDSLEKENERERCLSIKTVEKCEELHDEISKLKREVERQKEVQLQPIRSSHENLTRKQEKEIALAASKLSECQKTIASLGKKLTSLATLEDFVLDSEEPLDLISHGFLCPANGAEQWETNSTQLNFMKNYSESSNIVEVI